MNQGILTNQFGRGNGWGRGFVLAGAIAGVGVAFSSTEPEAALPMLAAVLPPMAAGVVAMSLFLLSKPFRQGALPYAVVRQGVRKVTQFLFRYMLLFLVYLVAIACIFLAEAVPEIVRDAFYRIALGLGASTLLWSFGLPLAVYTLHMHMLDDEVDRLRHERRDRELVALKREDAGE